jgi:hypothetical protein
VAISSLRSAQERLASSQPLRLSHSPSTGFNSGAYAGQVLHLQPRLGSRPGVQVARVMGAEVVPDDGDLLVAELVAKAVQRTDALAGVVGALQQVEPHPGRRLVVAVLAGRKATSPHIEICLPRR